jgi:hypothetical protein
LVLSAGLQTFGRAADDAAGAILDKAIQAAGGKEALEKCRAVHWKTQGKMFFNDNESSYTTEATADGLAKYRSVFEGEFGGNQVRGVTVFNGDHGWRVFGGMAQTLDRPALDTEKRRLYLQLVPRTLLPLVGEGFRLKAGSDQTIGGKPVAVLLVTGPDGKEFTLSFDKETGLPVKLEAEVTGFGGEEFTQETTFADYKDFDGIKLATRVESLRDGEKFIEQELLEFKPLDKVEATTFDEPK